MDYWPKLLLFLACVAVTAAIVAEAPTGAAPEALVSAD